MSIKPTWVLGIVALLVSAGLFMQCKTPGEADSGLRSEQGSEPAITPMPVTLTFVGHYFYKLAATIDSSLGVWTNVKYRIVRDGVEAPFSCNDPGFETIKKARFKKTSIEVLIDALKHEKLADLSIKPDRLGRAKLDETSFENLKGPLQVQVCLFDGNKIVKKGRTLASEKYEGFSLADGNYTILSHANECAQELGPIPDFNCLDPNYSMDLPITVDGQTPGTMAGDSTDKCDKPVLLGGMNSQCLQHSRIGRLPKQTGFEMVDTVFICRRYEKASGTNDKNFSDVAVVQTRRDTGATCWFQMLTGGNPPRDATNVPSPSNDTPFSQGSAVTKAEEFWLTPQNTAGIECFTCHDSDPFMHSPYVDQAIFAPGTAYPGEAVVPKVARNNTSHKYFAVGSQDSGFRTTRWRDIFTVSPKPSTGMDTTCTSCHRIGTHTTCSRWVQDSVGRSFVFNNYRTTWSKSGNNPHIKYWMPQFPNIMESAQRRPHNLTETKWLADYEKATDDLLECCSNPFSDKCERTKIPGGDTPLPPPPGQIKNVTIKIATGIDIPSGFSLAAPPNPVLIKFDDVINDAGTVEAIELKVTVEHSNINDLEIRLVSPDNRNAIAKNYGYDTLGGGSQTTTESYTISNSALGSLINSNARGDWYLDLWDPMPQNDGKLISAELILKIRINPSLAGN